VVASAAFGEAELTSMTLDSRQAKPGTLFVCMPGMSRDSHQFLAGAAEAGATAAIVHSSEGLAEARRLGLVVRQIEPAEFNGAVAKLAAEFYDHPTRAMKVIGITGTNGKTTTAWLVRDMLAAMGMRAAYLGTLGFQTPGIDRELSNTTPFAVELMGLLAEARDDGVEALAMEVSSHALDQHRVDGVEFDAAVFTNLTQDHLDYHETMDRYEAAKFRLFDDIRLNSEKPWRGAVNIDDPVGLRWSKRGEFLTFGHRESAQLRGRGIDVTLDRIRMSLQIGDEPEVIAEAALGGSYNVENLFSATAGVRVLTHRPISEIAAAWSAVRPVPGRFEAVVNDQGIGILVDYAHTPDALEKVLDAVRPLTSGRIITVFGCGGDRDRTKRPRMARAASERSDLTVVTSDNPRTEDPQAILDEVQAGVLAGRDSVSIVDRAEAVRYAVVQARPGDVVVIAGKGHENYQIVGRTKFPMDDRELARAGLAARGEA
jgi:UDP-N-acetylmuramoyl-L-alanyl-D-glutamate--2,6-diaminopimelate ligase